MGQVRLTVGGRDYDLACRDGDEQHLAALGQTVDARVAEAARAVGTGNAARQLVMGALLLADELVELRASGAGADGDVAAAVDALADRLEMLASRLEKRDATS